MSYRLVIEQIIEADTEYTACEYAKMLQDQDGFLMARILPPKTGMRGWAAQVFYSAGDVTFNDILPDGMNLRYASESILQH